MFTYNQKVVPIKKSAGIPLEDSSVWENAMDRGQEFLYFVGKTSDCDDEEVLCNFKPDTRDGDFFLPTDLIPYVEDEENEVELPDFIEVSLKDLIILEIAGFINENDKLLVRKA